MHDLAIALQVKKAMRKKMAMGGDVPDEHDQDMAEFKSDQEDIPLEMMAEEEPKPMYARGGMHMDPMSMVKAIRMKKMAAGGAVEANEALGKDESMDEWLSSGDADIEQETADPFMKRKARIKSALMRMGD